MNVPLLLADALIPASMAGQSPGASVEARSPLSPAHHRDGRRAGDGRSRASGQTVHHPQEEGSLSIPDRLFKIVFVGNSAVGKTSFLRRFCDDRFSPGMTATVGKFSPLNWVSPPLGRGG